MADPKAPSVQGPSESKRRAVCVEDDDDSREMIAMFLELEGFEVTLAPNGLDGIDKILHTRPEIALVDVGLPDIDGYEVARRVRSAPDTEAICLVAITGFGNERAKAKASEAGFRLHLTKPVDLGQLKEALERCLPSATSST